MKQNNRITEIIVGIEEMSLFSIKNDFIIVTNLCFDIKNYMSNVDYFNILSRSEISLIIKSNSMGYDGYLFEKSIESMKNCICNDQNQQDVINYDIQYNINYKRVLYSYKSCYDKNCSFLPIIPNKFIVLDLIDLNYTEKEEYLCALFGKHMCESVKNKNKNYDVDEYPFYKKLIIDQYDINGVLTKIDPVYVGLIDDSWVREGDWSIVSSNFNNMSIILTSSHVDIDFGIIKHIITCMCNKDGKLYISEVFCFDFYRSFVDYYVYDYLNYRICDDKKCSDLSENHNEDSNTVVGFARKMHNCKQLEFRKDSINSTELFSFGNVTPKSLFFPNDSAFNVTHSGINSNITEGNNNIALGIALGSCFGGVFFIIIAIVFFYCYCKKNHDVRHKKNRNSSISGKKIEKNTKYVELSDFKKSDVSNLKCNSNKQDDTKSDSENNHHKLNLLGGISPLSYDECEAYV